MYTLVFFKLSFQGPSSPEECFLFTDAGMKPRYCVSHAGGPKPMRKTWRFLLRLRPRQARKR